MDCILRNLDNPLLSGLSLGLSATKEGVLSVNPQFFACCAGIGMNWDSKASCYHTCTLKARLAKLEELMALYSKYFPNVARMPYQVTPAWSNQILQELAGTFKRDRRPATVAYSAQKSQPSLIWSKAFAAIWRFGMDVRFCRITDFDASELSLVTKHSPRPYAVFIEQVDKLWDPGIVEAVEYVVQQVYNSDAFLWVDFVYEPMTGVGEETGNSVRQTLARRLSQLKDKHPLDLLSRDCLSRLQGLSGIQHRTGNTHA